MDEGVKYPCKLCNHQATAMGHLARYKRAVHEGVKYPCRDCGHQSTSKEALPQHKRAVHEGVIEVDFGRKIWELFFQTSSKS